MTVTSCIPESHRDTLDLRWNKTDYSAFFSELELESLVESFSALMECCNHALSRNLDWWFEPLSARNNFGSPLFHHFICFHLCLKLSKEKNYPERCLTDCDVLHQGILTLMRRGAWQGELVHTRKHSWATIFAKRVRTFWHTTLSVFVPFLYLRLFLRSEDSKEVPPILVDTFMLPGQEKKDRYYAGVFEHLTPDEQTQIRLVPTFHGYVPKDFPTTLRLLAEQEDRFLFKEHYLGFADYLHALAHSLRLFAIQPPRMPVGPFDFGRLIREELGRFGGFEDAVHGFLNLAFAKRLRALGARLIRVVDWHENHGRDRGWNYGFRLHFPDLPTVGYAPGSISQWYLSAAPLPSERKRGMLPDCLKVPGRHLAAAARKRDPKLHVETTGAFRFSKPVQVKTGKAGPLRVLVPLSYDLNLANHACRLARSLVSPAAKEKIRLIFKPHPAADPCRIGHLQAEGITVGETWSDRTFPEELAQADTVLGCWTTSLLEAVVAGVPAGILPLPDGLFHNPIPKGAAEGWSFNVDSPETFFPLLAFARECRNSPVFPPADILEPPTRKAALELLGLPRTP